MKKILLVEDNEQNIYLICYLLEKGGYEVTTARTGEEGVERAIEMKPDLIIMDIELPGIDGLEAARQIRASEGVGHVPIVALTSYAMLGDEERVIAAGCTGYMEKPIDPDRFIDELKTFIK